MKSYGVTIQMKATEQYFPVVLFTLLYNWLQPFLSKKCERINIQMNPHSSSFHGTMGRKKRTNQFSISSNKSFLGKRFLDSCSPFKTISFHNLIDFMVHLYFSSQPLRMP